MQRTFILVTVQNHGNMFLGKRSSVQHRLLSSVWCMYNFVLRGFLLVTVLFSCRPGLRLINVDLNASGWKTTKGHIILTIMFKNVLRAFEAGIFKLFKNIHSQLKN